ncbi:bcl-2-related ovarian killer protein isoform X1 [Parus major]|uniref:bcl-2-related ovarian killer protein isoform X1 n=1 Tax=Parus major TaxID=9157 RepID=UPI001443B1DD|nr:bcl-2-related ovarian killer protein isoform X1 [Parus major]
MPQCLGVSWLRCPPYCYDLIFVFSTQSSVGGQEHVKGQAGGALDLKASPELSRWKDLAESPRNLVPSLSKSGEHHVVPMQPESTRPAAIQPPARNGDELEYIRPNVYRNIARQLNISLHSETVVSDAFLAVAAQIFTAGITWGKVVSLYAVAAGLAVDCVRHAQPAMVHTIVDCLGEFVRKTLVTWLKRRGGWADITKCVVNTDPSLRSHWLVAAVCSFGHFLKAIFFVLLPER